MEEIRKYTIAVLKDLLRTSNDECSLLKTASEKSDNTEVKSLLSKYAEEKFEHMAKLESEIIRLGGYPDENISHLDFSDEGNIQSTSANDPDNLIAECIKKDDIAIKRYFNAIRKNILWEVIPLVAKQYFGSKVLHDQIRNVCLDKMNHAVRPVHESLIK